MMLACKVGYARDQLFTDALPAMMRRDDESGHSTNRRAVWHIRDEFGASQARDLASRLRKEKAARAAWQRMAESATDIGLA